MKQSSIRIDPQWPAIFPVDTEATVCSHKMIEGSRELPRCHQHRFCGRRQAGKQASSPRRSAGDPTGGSWSRGAFPARGRVIHGRSRGAAAAKPSSQLQFCTPLVPHLVIELSPARGSGCTHVHSWESIAHVSHASAAVRPSGYVLMNGYGRASSSHLSAACLPRCHPPMLPFPHRRGWNTAVQPAAPPSSPRVEHSRTARSSQGAWGRVSTEEPVGL